jgi:hypothetical protein
MPLMSNYIYFTYNDHKLLSLLLFESNMNGNNTRICLTDACVRGDTEKQIHVDSIVKVRSNHTPSPLYSTTIAAVIIIIV